MSWAQPTAQYGHTPGNALASLIRSDVAAASTGLRSMAPEATAVEAAAMPYLRKSRRDRLIATLLCARRRTQDWRVRSDSVPDSALDLGARQFIPCPAQQDDPVGTPARRFNLDDVPRVQRVETRLGVLVRDHERLFGTRELGTDVSFPPHPQPARGTVDPD